MIRRVLVPLDGSPLAEASLPYARAVAESYLEEASLGVCAAHRRSAHAPWPYGTVSGSLLGHGESPILIVQKTHDRDARDAPFRSNSVRAPGPRATWPA